MNFDQAFDRLIGHEGKFTANPADDGNWTGGRQGRGELKGTKYGISAAAYPHLDIKGLTLEQAKAIYLEDFWDVIGRAHPAIKFQMFDAAVNHGLGNAVRILQRAVMVADDGIWGPRSQVALDSMQELRGHNDVLLRFLGFRLKFWASLAKFDQFGRGWTNRGAENLLFAAEDN
ncbi:secretion activator protein [Delftia tsuruhatensis]|nr:glycosyl hydrolase 108 family protein [Delftia tsuruhatensis]MDH0776829.1 secretion activator protein [Delftia tsuruhatensis]MDH1460292.1 secretion activator protein [Delftia tsuruhatensis]MDH1825714.1 secretion activator protein [Delftia tsuruhatensis]WGG12290.1 secretion activator protein [Delftia tsuruhatensis]